MPTLNAFDYSWARPAPSAMKATGIKVVARYLHRSPKGLTAQEIDALHTAGIGIVANYEATSGNHLLGAPQGQVDGREARQIARELGFPAGTPIYYSCDHEVTPSQMGTVLAYLHAADDPIYPARCYAQHDVCEAFGRPAWQTLAWSNGQVSPRAVLYQYAINETFQGSAVDYNTVLNQSQLGAWWPAGSSESASSNGAVQIGETDVPLTPAEVDAISIRTLQRMAGLYARVDGLTAAVAKLQATAGAIPEASAIRTTQYSAGVVSRLDAMKPQIQSLQETLLAAVAAHTQTITSTGTVDLSPVLTAISALPAEVRAELAKHLGA